MRVEGKVKGERTEEGRRWVALLLGDWRWIAYVNSAGDMSVVASTCDGTANCTDYVLYAVTHPLTNPTWTPNGNLLDDEQAPLGSRVSELQLSYTSGSPLVTGMPLSVYESTPSTYGLVKSLSMSADGQKLLVTIRRVRDTTDVVERWERVGGGWDTTRPENEPIVRGKRPTFVYQQQGGTATPAGQPADTEGLYGRYYNSFSILDAPAINRVEIAALLPATPHNFSQSWDLTGLASPDRFAVIWTGKIIFAPADPNPVPATPTGTPAVETIRFLLCFTTSGGITERVQLWIAGSAVILTQQANEYCGIWDTNSSAFSLTEEDIYIEYWRFASANQTGIPTPAFNFTWQAIRLSNGNLVPNAPDLIPRSSVPASRLSPVESAPYSVGSLPDKADCSDNIIHLLPTFPGAGQEITDMQAVANPSGLIIHDGPTWNAVQFGTIPWGQSVQVDARMVFTQTGGIADQVWYRIAGTSITNDQWFAVRMPGTVGTSIQTFVYAVGLGALDGSENAFCVSVGNINGNELISFTYDRQAAAEYAITHSYNNNTTARSLGRVTERTTTLLPFADFYYSDLNPTSTDVEATGSAQFISEALWLGGMSMTTGDDNNCAALPPIVNFGWRYCRDVQTSSKPWSVHGGILAHFTQADVSIPSQTTSNILETAGTLLGTQVIFQGLFREDRISTREDFVESGIYTNLSSGGSPDFDRNLMGTFALNHLSTIQYGDYVYIIPEATPHGLLIVGWQTANVCPNVLSNNNNQLFTSATLYSSRSEAFNQGVINPVPYVADYTTAQSPMPRPFYCTRYIQTVSPPPGQTLVTSFGAHDYYFYRIPDEIRLLPRQLFTNVT
jgi:hypothetical protein